MSSNSLFSSSNPDYYQLPCAVPSRWGYITSLLSERIDSSGKLLKVISRLRSNTDGKTGAEIADEESRVDAEALAAAAARKADEDEDEADSRAAFRHPPQPSLYYFLHDYCPIEVRENFFANALPTLQKLALEMPKLFPSQQLPRLREPESATHETRFSRKQTLCLVAHMFFCTLDKQSVEYWASYSAMYDWWKSEPILAYLRVLIEYFTLRAKQIVENDPELEQMICVKRCAIRQSREAFGEGISKSTQTLCNLTMGGLCNFHDVNSYKAASISSSSSSSTSTTSSGDSLASELLEIDFANKDISWGRGGTQEELILGMSPETHILPLLLDTLQDHEAAYISNVQRIGEYKGYGCDAMFKNTFQPPILTDATSKATVPLRSIGGMDALNLWEELIENRKKQGKTFEEEEYDSPIVHLELMQLQSQENMILRDIIKAFVTFSASVNPSLQSNSSSSSSSSPSLVVLTGPWGCSSFGGNLFLKLLIQWIAASLAGVSELRYQSFQHVESLEDEVAQLLPWARGEHREKVTVGLLFQCMKEWSTQLSQIQSNSRRFEFDAQAEVQELFQMIRQKLEAQL